MDETQHCKRCNRDLPKADFHNNRKYWKQCNICRVKKTASTKIWRDGGKKPGRDRRFVLKECQDLAESKGGKCLSTEYKNIITKMKWQCPKGHEWETPMATLRNMGCWCPQCSGYKSEELCREIIEDNLLEKFPKKRPKWLEGLELDGYNEELNIAFEYNGIQHYEYNEHFHRGDPERFEAQKARDRKKYRLCREHKVNLIIIPYQYDYKHPKELEDFILNELMKFA